MPNTKTYLSDDRTPPQSQIGASLESLAHTIHERRNAGDESYTHRLLTGDIDTLLKKVAEEAHEATLAAKDVVYNEGDEAWDEDTHTVVEKERTYCSRCGVSPHGFAGTLRHRP